MKTFKRALDIGIVLGSSVVTVPVMAVAALLIASFMGMPVFWFHRRPGEKGRRFRLCKFRTMTEERRDGRYLPDEQRLTELGRFLRRLSLDELPQLWNVLCGDMSIVGPRPLLEQYLERYNERQMRRHDVKPGITGWAQINGRNALSWEEKLELDVWYVEHWSLALDLKIIWLTFLKVIRQEGVSHPGHVTMPEFQGTSASSGLCGEIGGMCQLK